MGPLSHTQAVRANRLAFAEATASGEITPWPLLPGLLAASAPALYLMLPRNAFFDSWTFKYPIFVAVTSYQVYSAATYAVPANRIGYLYGVLSAFSILAYIAFVLLHDVKHHFRRVDQVQVETEDGRSKSKYVWQPFPEHSLWERLDWVVDLCMNFRGVGWNWQTLDVPGFPEHVRRDLDPQSLSKANMQPSVSKAGCRRYDDRATLVKVCSQDLLHCCLLASVLWAIVLNDPYFAGSIRAPPPAFLPRVLQSPRLVQLYRALVPGVMMYNGIRGIYTAKALAVVLFGPKFLGFRADPWMLPETGGPFANILDRGLSGFWGGWWHQTFRFTFMSFGEGVVRLLHLRPSSTLGKVIATVAVFTASGLMHAMGSHMQYQNTHPFSGTFTFFFLQSFGVLIEQVAEDVGKGLGITLPRPIRRALCLSWILVWFMMVAPFATDDMAKGESCHVRRTVSSLTRVALGGLWSFEIPQMPHVKSFLFSPDSRILALAGISAETL